MSVITKLEAEKPLVLILSEPGLKLGELVENFLVVNSLETKLLLLDESFFKQAELFLKQKRPIYKAILLYGFDEILADFYKELFDFLETLNKQQDQKIPVLLLSSSSSPIQTIEQLDKNYDLFLFKQKTFLSSFLNEFPSGQIFLAQDLILTQPKITYPLLFFFAALSRGHLLDLQKKFYFQDELSFFEMFKTRLIKPHTFEKFLLKGKTITSEALLHKISYLYEQYFQKKLTVLKIFAEEKPADFLKEFKLVKNSSSNVNALIDQKVRLLPSLKNRKTGASALSLEVLRRVTEASEKRARAEALQEAQKDQEKTLKENFLSLFRKAQKTSPALPQKEVHGALLEDKIEKIFSFQRSLEKQSRQDENVEYGKKIIEKTKKRKWAFWLGLAIFITGFTALFLLVLFNFSQKQLQKRLFLAAKGGEEIIEKIDKSILYSIFNFQHQQYRKFLLEESLTQAADVVRLKEALFNLTTSRREYQQNSFNLYKKTLEGGVELTKLHEDNLSALDKKITAEKAFNAYLMDLNLELYEGEEQEFWKSELEETKTNLRESLQSQRLLKAFQDLLLKQGRANLLILIQDSNELRSSGGLLTEAVVLSFDNGFLIDKQVFSIDELSNRVYGNRAAPAEIKKFLQEETFYLRDANWGADFFVIGADVAWFFEQALGQKMDVLAAVNSKTIVKILEVVGDLSLQNEENVTANSFLNSLRTKALLDYKNQGELKFSWQFARSLLDKFLNLNQSQFVKVGNVLQDALNQRELLLFSNHPELQQGVEVNSWGGKKIEVLCPPEFKQENCLTDSFFQLESNISINKVGAFIDRKINHDIGITSAFIRHRRKIVFENTSLNDLWPLGEYRAFLKFYFNRSANLEKVELNGQQLSGADFALNVGETYSELSLAVSVSRSEAKELVITYTIPNQESESFSYVFFDQKQAGIFNKKTSYQVVFDEELKPQLVTPTTSYQNKILQFSNNNDDHFLFAIDFSRASQ